MRIEIEIPYLFECDYNKDKFNDFFSRVLSDIHNGVLCGRYEEEIAEMFINALAESKLAYDVEAKVAELEIEKETANRTFCTFEQKVDLGRVFGLEKAISIVRGKE